MQTITRTAPIKVTNIGELFAISERTELAFVEFTPNVAGEILSNHNQTNRPMSTATILKYEKDMKNDAWIDGVTEISFDVKKQLADGQHRLQALFNVQKPQVFKVSFNEPLEAFKVIDSGKKRTPSDALALAGYKNKATLSAMIRKYNHYLSKKGNMWNISTPCNSQETLNIVENNPTMTEISAFVDNTKHIQFIGNKSDIATAYYILKRVDSEKADIFMKDFLINEVNPVYNDVDYRTLIVATRQKMMENKNLKGKVVAGRKSDPHDGESRTYWYIFDAWNKFIKGDNTLPSFKVSRAKEESFPRVESFFAKK